MRRAAARTAGAALLFSCFAAGAASSAHVHTVVIEQLRFNPAVLVVHRGDRIVWVNHDLFPHTVTAKSKSFDSGSIPPQRKWTYRARKSGEYEYGCSFHPTMKGKLVVR